MLQLRSVLQRWSVLLHPWSGPGPPAAARWRFDRAKRGRDSSMRVRVWKKKEKKPGSAKVARRGGGKEQMANSKWQMRMG